MNSAMQAAHQRSLQRNICASWPNPAAASQRSSTRVIATQGRLKQKLATPSLMTAFQYVVCRKSGPRQGKDMRFCVVSRQRMPRSLLWRVVRVRKADGSTMVTLDEGQGRSAYVSKDLASVTESLRRKRLNKALRAPVPEEIWQRLANLAAEWDSIPAAEKGMLFCDVYAMEVLSAAVDEVQQGFLVPIPDSENWL